MFRHSKVHDIDHNLLEAVERVGSDVLLQNGSRLFDGSESSGQSPAMRQEEALWNTGTSFTRSNSIPEQRLDHINFSNGKTLPQTITGEGTSNECQTSAAMNDVTPTPGNSVLTLPQGSLLSAHESAQHLQSDFSMGLVDPNPIPQNPDGDLWPANLISPGPAWLIGYDFDLDALNTSVMTTMDTVEPLFQLQGYSYPTFQLPEPENEIIPEIQQQSKDGRDNVRRSWFSHLEAADNANDEYSVLNTGHITPAIGGERYDVDDGFRARVTLKLNTRTIEDHLPSTEYLVSYPS
jgi:hypothetical protein